jgi:hypothetical protein
VLANKVPQVSKHSTNTLGELLMPAYHACHSRSSSMTFIRAL